MEEEKCNGISYRRARAGRGAGILQPFHPLPPSLEGHVQSHAARKQEGLQSLLTEQPEAAWLYKKIWEATLLVGLQGGPGSSHGTSFASKSGAFRRSLSHPSQRVYSVTRSLQSVLSHPAQLIHRAWRDFKGFVWSLSIVFVFLSSGLSTL